MSSNIRLLCGGYVVCFAAFVVVLAAPQTSKGQRAIAYPTLPQAQPLPQIGEFTQSYQQVLQQIRLATSPPSISLGGGFGGGAGNRGFGGGLGGFGGGLGGFGGGALGGVGGGFAGKALGGFNGRNAL